MPRHYSLAAVQEHGEYEHEDGDEDGDGDANGQPQYIDHILDMGRASDPNNTLSPQAMEAAKRFLWDQDDNEIVDFEGDNNGRNKDPEGGRFSAAHAYSRQRVDQSVNLMDVDLMGPAAATTTTPPQPTRSRSMPTPPWLFGTKQQQQQKQQQDPYAYNDASCSGEAEEFIDETPSFRYGHRPRQTPSPYYRTHRPSLQTSESDAVSVSSFGTERSPTMFKHNQPRKGGPNKRVLYCIALVSAIVGISAGSFAVIKSRQNNAREATSSFKDDDMIEEVLEGRDINDPDVIVFEGDEDDDEGEDNEDENDNRDEDEDEEELEEDLEDIVEEILGGKDEDNPDVETFDGSDNDDETTPEDVDDDFDNDFDDVMNKKEGQQGNQTMNVGKNTTYTFVGRNPDGNGTGNNTDDKFDGLAPIIKNKSKALQQRRDGYRLTLLDHDTSAEFQTALDTDGSPQNLALEWLAARDYGANVQSESIMLTRYGLATLFYATNGNDWNDKSGWLDEIEGNNGDIIDFDLCDWHGIECEVNHHNGRKYTERLIGLNLTDNNLKGIVPDEFRFAMQNLQVLDLSMNSLGGRDGGPVISDVLWQATTEVMRELHLRQTGMVGTFPDKLRWSSNLVVLDLGQNDLKGRLPVEVLRYMSNLITLTIDENELTGVLPDLSGLSNLDYLNVRDNKFEGDFPMWISKLPDLRDVRLSDNEPMSGGEIPEDIQRLAKLEALYASNINLAGPIPDVFTTMRRLKHLDLGHNLLIEKLPQSMMYLENLESIVLRNNMIEGEIPDMFGNWLAIQSVDLSDNKFEGTIPESFGGLEKLQSLRLRGNGLNGSIPSSLADCDALEKLNLDDNKLVGPVPSELGYVTTLREFNIHKNSLEGDMPEAVCDLVQSDILLYLTADCLATNDMTPVPCECCHRCY